MLNRKKIITTIGLLVILIGISSCSGQNSDNSVLTPSNTAVDKTIALSNLGDLSALASGTDSSGNFLMAVGTDKGVNQVKKAQVLKSTDGGQTWSNSGSLGLSNATAFTTVKNDDTILWVVGGSPNSQEPFVIMTSTNDGKNWVTGQAPGDSAVKQLLGVNVGSKSYIFAVSVDGDLYVSSDFAKTWSQVKTGMSYISAINEETLSGSTKLFIAGHDADETNDVILSSTDNGDSWSNPLYNQPKIGSINKIFTFAQNQQTMIIVSNDLGTRSSLDNGKTWNLFDAKVGAANSFTSGLKDNKQAIFAGGNGGENGALSYSTDFGISWSPLVATPGVGAISKVVAIDNGSNTPLILVAGNSLSKITDKFSVSGRVAISSDLNTSWSYLNMPDNIKSINSVSGLEISKSINLFMAVTYNDLNSSLIYSNNTGETWIKKDLPMNPDNIIVTALDIVNNKGNPVLFVAMADQNKSYLYKSENMGDSWVSLTIPSEDSNAQISEITATRDSSILLVKVSDVILSSNDLGKSWISHKSTNPDILNNLSKISAVKLNGKVILIGGLGLKDLGSTSDSYISEDMGLTWNQPSWLSSIGGSIYAVYLAGNKYYAISAYSSYIAIYNFNSSEVLNP